MKNLLTGMLLKGGKPNPTSWLDPELFVSLALDCVLL